MKRIVVCLMMAALLAIGAYAQGGAALPTVDQVLDKYVAAVGGKAALDKQTTRVEKGTLEIPAFGMTGNMESFAKAPNKTAFVLDLPGFGMVKQGFDGKIAWAQDPQTGLRELSGAELAAMKLNSDFHRDTRLKVLYPKITVKGKDKVGEKEVIVLEATPAEGSVEQWYFDVATGLMVRRDFELDSPLGKTPIQSFVDSYMEVDGLKIPSATRQVRPDMTFNVKVTEVKHNVPIDDAKFVKPAN
jgi:outer membrane lipoprotein-sorting protein